jgi:hypothetical protein
MLLTVFGYIRYASVERGCAGTNKSRRTSPTFAWYEICGEKITCQTLPNFSALIIFPKINDIIQLYPGREEEAKEEKIPSEAA